MCQHFNNILQVASFNKLIDKPTRVTATGATLLDNIYTNTVNCFKTGCSGILTSGITDHYPVFMIRDGLRKDQTVLYRQQRNYRQVNVYRFQKRPSNCTWLHHFINVQNSFSHFDCICTAIMKYSPSKLWP